jgi:hypothetical protein
MPPAHVPATDPTVEDLEELIESTVALRRQLVTHEAVCRRILAEVEDQVPIGCVLPAVRADRWRAAVTDAIKGFESTRHRVRLDLVGMSLDDGMTIAEIARSWGVSRQLASRWVQGAVALRGPCAGPFDGDFDGPFDGEATAQRSSTGTPADRRGPP